MGAVGLVILISMIRFESPFASVESVTPLIKAAMKDEYDVEKTFKFRSRLTGVVVHKKADPEDKSVYFLTPDKKSFIVGQVFDEKGDNVSEEAVRKNLDVDKVMKHLQDKGKSAQVGGAQTGIQAGIDVTEDVLKDAPGVFAGVSGDVPKDARILYVFADPNCIYCHRMYEAIANSEAVLKELNVRVKWITVAVLIPNDSVRKAQAIVKGGYDAFIKNETDYNTSTHRGGIEGIDDPQYFEIVKSNTKMFNSIMPGTGTPAYVWFKDGQMKRDMGALTVDKVRGFIEQKM